jgi:hypothetical protein
MAQQDGIIRQAKGGVAAWPKVEKRIEEIRKALRNHFRIAADPVPFVQGIGYQASFKIGCSLRSARRRVFARPEQKSSNLFLPISQ